MDISIGRYLPFKSIIHRLDARIKLFGLVVFMALILFNTSSYLLNFTYYLILFLIILTLIIVSKVRILQVFKQLKALWFMFAFMLIINVLTHRTPDQNLLFNIGSVKVYDAAIFQTLYIFIRLVLMLCLTLVLTATTKPLDLTYALSWYMAPLKIIKFPVHEVAMTMSLALRFIPTLLDETGRIMKAQESRGVDFKKGKMKEKIKGIISLIVPLFVSAFQRSEELANAMEARGYNPLGKRTSYRKLSFALRDFISLLILLILLTLGILFLVFDKQILVFIQPYFDQLVIFVNNIISNIRGLVK